MSHEGIIKSLIIDCLERSTSSVPRNSICIELVGNIIDGRRVKHQDVLNAINSLRKEGAIIIDTRYNLIINNYEE